MFNWFKKKEQKNKIKRLDLALKKVRATAMQYLSKNDPKILALSENQLLLGVIEILCEDEILKSLQEGKPIALAHQQAPPMAPKMSPEQEFDQPEFLDKAKRQYH